ncbi:hypothetical protein ACFFF5_11825 [Lederbergia wuyishanensis]|uniref:Uncharacterized protein n=1 Tax=Lederbergia wuyishanensis TaxID=1347903 RepID=A0ABU0D3M4_9BACI|nr:hypothetical protein [Lederbergia wuyishanensis]MCJ8007830.1 hypothetical protein [Lederbergia wuyishanensis]MDQ0343002.1 hypothetical protein [Lederbergia wuyishanensis]
MKENDHFKRQLKEHKKNPMINLADSINRSMTGDLHAFSGSGCFSIILTLIIIGGVLLLYQCSN